MKLNRLLCLVLAFMMVGAVTVFADDAIEWYKGKKVKVTVNGKELQSPGLIIDDRTMLPLREISETLQSVVRWDERTQTVSIFKPNVHISLMQQLKDGSFITFGQVTHKRSYNFNVFTQFDNISTKVHSVKVAIEDPFGQVVYEHEEKVAQQNENLWYGTPEIKGLEFKHLGKYAVKAFMKIDEKGEYFLVSEKKLPSISN